MKASRFLVLNTFVVAAVFANGQAGAPPKGVSEALNRLQPFFGEYMFESPWENKAEIWKGKVVVRPVIEGWYVQWTYLPVNKGRKRENRWMITYDPRTAKYRAWRFETGPVLANAEGRVNLDNDRLTVEWDMTRPNGATGVFRTIHWLDKARDLHVLAEWEEVGKPAVTVQEAVSKRRRR